MNIYIKYYYYFGESEKIQPSIKGDWIDLRAAETIDISGLKIHNKEIIYTPKLVSLGVSMQLPKGYEAIIVPRSSLFTSKGVILANSIGVIDNTYSGNEDIWKAQLIAFKDTQIIAGERILQFRIQLSQKATIFQKLKWLFTQKIQFIEVSQLIGNNRGGFGSTKGYKNSVK